MVTMAEPEIPTINPTDSPDDIKAKKARYDAEKRFYDEAEARQEKKRKDDIARLPRRVRFAHDRLVGFSKKLAEADELESEAEEADKLAGDYLNLCLEAQAAGDAGNEALKKKKITEAEAKLSDMIKFVNKFPVKNLPEGAKKPELTVLKQKRKIKLPKPSLPLKDAPWYIKYPVYAAAAPAASLVYVPYKAVQLTGRGAKWAFKEHPWISTSLAASMGYGLAASHGMLGLL